MQQVSLVPISAALRLEDAVDEVLGRVLGELNELEGFSFQIRTVEEKVEGPFVVLIMSGGSERKTVDFVADKPDPIVLLAHPSNNSLPAALEIATYLQGMGRQICLVQTLGNWIEEVRDLLTAILARNRLQGLRIGRIGYEDETRYPFTGDPVELIRKNWGPEVVDIPFVEVIERYQQYSGHPQATEPAQGIVQASTGVKEPSADDLRGAAAVYLALKEIAGDYELAAVALKCFDLLPALQNTACFALAKLNEDGIVAACEGDIISALGMLLLRELTGEPSFLANPSMVDVEAGQITLAHCTIPRTMCSEHAVRSHFESGLGVAFQGTLPDGVYTLFRIGGATLQDLYVAKALYVSSGQDERLCRTQVTLQFAERGKALSLLRRPLGNHHLLVRGDHADKLRIYAQLFLSTNPGQMR